MSIIIKKINSFKKRSFIKKLLTILCALVILFVSTAGMYWVRRICKNYYDNNVFKSLDISGVDKLMIVAHPDDETIWGGGHLIEGGYLVVCLTDSHKKGRKNEFVNAVIKANETNIPIILDFPDKTFGIRDNWFGIKGKITNTVNSIIKMKDWDLIVTHNKDGEYGHIQHKAVSDIVKNEYTKLGKQDDLYFFGTYHSKKKISYFENQMIPMDNELYNKKIENLKSFPSQKNIINKLFHMIRYENWTQYNN